MVLGQISRAFHFRDRKTFLQLYKTYVRPHLDYACQAWSPWQRADIDKLEKVQERAVKQISGLRGSTYVEKLQELGLTTLEERRHVMDMVSVYRVITGKDDVDPNIWFQMAADGERATRQATGTLNVRPKFGRHEEIGRAHV